MLFLILAPVFIVMGLIAATMLDDTDVFVIAILGTIASVIAATVVSSFYDPPLVTKTFPLVKIDGSYLTPDGDAFYFDNEGVRSEGFESNTFETTRIESSRNELVVVREPWTLFNVGGSGYNTVYINEDSDA